MSSFRWYSPAGRTHHRSASHRNRCSDGTRHQIIAMTIGHTGCDKRLQSCGIDIATDGHIHRCDCSGQVAGLTTDPALHEKTCSEPRYPQSRLWCRWPQSQRARPTTSIRPTCSRSDHRHRRRAAITADLRDRSDDRAEHGLPSTRTRTSPTVAHPLCASHNHIIDPDH